MLWIGVFSNRRLTNIIWNVGVKGTNTMMLGSGVQILEAAVARASLLGGVTTPTFVNHMDIKVKASHEFRIRMELSRIWLQRKIEVRPLKNRIQILRLDKTKS